MVTEATRRCGATRSIPPNSGSMSAVAGFAWGRTRRGRREQRHEGAPGGPDVPEVVGVVGDCAAGVAAEVVGGASLGGHVEGVEAGMVLSDVERHGVLTLRAARTPARFAGWHVVGAGPVVRRLRPGATRPSLRRPLQAPTQQGSRCAGGLDGAAVHLADRPRCWFEVLSLLPDSRRGSAGSPLGLRHAE